MINPARNCRVSPCLSVRIYGGSRPIRCNTRTRLMYFGKEAGKMGVGGIRRGVRPRARRMKRGVLSLAGVRRLINSLLIKLPS